MNSLRNRCHGVGALLAALLFAGQTFAANPFLPSWEYIPDGEPRVFGDPVYLYGSHVRAWSKAFCDKVLKVMTHNTIFSRKACVERVTIEPDGRIKEVEQTSLGFETSLNPYRTTGAEIACVLHGGNYVVELDYDTHPVILNRAGSVIGYKYFDFGSAAAAEVTFTADIRLGTAAGQMELWLDGWEETTGKKIGAINLEAPAKPDGNWRKVSTQLQNLSGRHALYFKFTGAGGQETICDVKSFRFTIRDK